MLLTMILLQVVLSKDLTLTDHSRGIYFFKKLASKLVIKGTLMQI